MKPNLKIIFFLAILIISFVYIKGANNQSFKRQKDGPWEFIGKANNVTSSLAKTDSQIKVEIKEENSKLNFSQDLNKANTNEKNGEVIFENQEKSTKISYKIIANGIKEQLTIYNKPQTNKFKINMTLDNLTIGKNFDNLPIFYDENGNYKFHFDKPFAVDNKGNKIESLVYNIHQIGSSNNYEVELEIDKNWLENPQTSYPVTIDPTVIKDPQNAKPEIIGKRTQNTNTFLVDSKYAVRSDLSPVNFKDKDGKWKEIDTFIDKSENPDYVYSVSKNVFQTFFKDKTQDFFISYQTGSSSLKFKINSAQNSTAQVSENTITYPEVFKNTDLKYTISVSNLLEEFIVKDKQTASSISEIKEELKIENADFEAQIDGSINFYKKGTKEILWIVPKPVMYELNDTSQTNYGLHYEISCPSNSSNKSNLTNCPSPILTKVIDKEGKSWLSSPDRIYPLVIDTTAGPSDPGTMADSNAVGTLTWTTPDNAKTSNNIYANVFSSAASTSHYLKATNFGFAIPAGTIDGIVVEVERYMSGSGVVYRDSAVKIVKADDTIGSTNKGDLTTIWPTTDPNTYVTYGASNNTWDLSWTPDNINDLHFGVVLSVVSASSSFYKDTLVSTLDGSKKISEVQVGDKVYSFNLSANRIEADEVTGVSHTLVDTRFICIHPRSGVVIKATPNHLFYVKSNWVKASDLSVGDLLLDQDGTEVPISEINVEEQSINEVWDLTVKNNSNFFAGGVLVHNGPGRFAYVDHIRMTVYYTEATPTPTPTIGPPAGMKFSGLKMSGIKINPGPTPTP